MSPFLRRSAEFFRPLYRRLPVPIKAPLRRWILGPAEPKPSSPGSEYGQRLAVETEAFTAQTDVHDLPAIAHYWSNRYLLPKLEAFGFSNPDGFFARYLELAHAGADSRPVRFASLGCGNCDTEVRVAGLLAGRGLRDFIIDCVDINRAMLDRGQALAAAAGVSEHIRPVVGDFNDWRPETRYAAIMANQSLHHVLKLEGLFAAIEQALDANGRLVTSDMIGRNGHMRWPEALEIVQEFWAELPPQSRYNVQLKRHEERFGNWDCSSEGFEGIRAQDVLRLLIERFDFELFVAYANLIDIFIDRSFGPHFDVNEAADLAFIDRVHARDEAEILAGRIKPTHMMAVLRKRPYAGETQTFAHLTPRFCLRP
ncbi:MAG: class I SAM-dependent methyltransferase [Dokdonella sp.]|nr:class I SAM-dependent methyltransferase [Dokdonella sp.]